MRSVRCRGNGRYLSILSCLLVLMLCGGSHLTAAGISSDPGVDPWVAKTVVIIKSSSSFLEAKAAAVAAASRLNVPLDLRNLTESKVTGLTLPRAECEEDGGAYPCYMARGRYDDGVYISVEYSNAYRGFAKRLFIVVVASGFGHDELLQQALAQARKEYPDAYAKVTKVYMGCMH